MEEINENNGRSEEGLDSAPLLLERTRCWPVAAGAPEAVGDLALH